METKQDSPPADPAEGLDTVYRWTLREIEDESQVEALSESLNQLPTALARSLLLREVDSFEEARTFFRPALDRLHDPYEMRDMDRGAARVAKAIRDGERTMVYGDYDVDGVTSTAVLWLFFRDHVGVELDYYIPHRLREGYGLNTAAIDVLAERGTKVLITVDNGSSAVKEIAHATALGLDVVAEGVEDEVTANLLRDMGCDMIQGYLLTPPLPFDEMMDWLDKNHQQPDHRKLG